MRASGEVRVVVAAGGLGTRVHHWARYLPKEFHPVCGRPGITWILEEIAGLGAAHIVIVYHPYYRAFTEWAGQALSSSGETRYRRAAGTADSAAMVCVSSPASRRKSWDPPGRRSGSSSPGSPNPATRCASVWSFAFPGPYR